MGGGGFVVVIDVIRQEAKSRKYRGIFGVKSREIHGKLGKIV